MNKMRMMSALYASLIGIGLVLMPASQAAAGKVVSRPSWSQQINDSSRFTVLDAFGGAAVLDKETGLVWERSPDGAWLTWNVAQLHCNVNAVGGRKGWRLPTLQELASLVDPTQFNPALPLNHPFQNTLSFFFWSATTYDLDVSLAWGVDFNDGNVPNVVSKADYLLRLAWCVRGGQGVDSQ